VVDATGLQGAPPDRRCPACGHYVGLGDRFCAACGTLLELVATRPVDAPVSLGGDRFRVEGVLGEGIRKRVYLARDTVLDRDVAVAVVRADGLTAVERERVEREVRLLARLGTHPNVVVLHDVIDVDGATAMVFEYLPGGSVADLLAVAGVLPVRDALRIGEQIARALDAVHRAGVFFRDVKPGNVLLTGDGTAKLCDFGLAFRLETGKLTDPGLVVGSLAYLAPERVARRHYDERSDLYALGVVCYEMLAGEPPFVGDLVDEVGAQHLHAEPPALRDRRPEVPERVAVLVHALLAKRFEDRPQTAIEVADELARCRADLDAARAVSG